ncbi:carboxymuconolactone decarboxylase family protein [Microlunatus parietis]|uniref:AhpD family alkylhydroperoxidase n=1 Tax=Microlunatus parietis TaxID=682979 RepID=A0A7Y9I485_9ACTN|nr:carboxymuconolactone decarboxylase family protein [Microlunatus parietis]NYE69700.1 AhpD family alkylhydroperoxidase [Microlunatus parietis]
MEARMKNPAGYFPEAGKALYALGNAIRDKGVPAETLQLVHLRTSQINGCAPCLEAGFASARKDGESDQRLATIPAWREAPYFTDAEKAALGLAEAITRLSDRPDPVPDDVWNAAAEHYGEKELAVLVLWIATTNTYNRLNVSTRQQPGSWS